MEYCSPIPSSFLLVSSSPYLCRHPPSFRISNKRKSFMALLHHYLSLRWPRVIVSMYVQPCGTTLDSKCLTLNTAFSAFSSVNFRLKIVPECKRQQLRKFAGCVKIPSSSTFTFYFTFTFHLTFTFYLTFIFISLLLSLSLSLFCSNWYCNWCVKKPPLLHFHFYVQTLPSLFLN